MRPLVVDDCAKVAAIHREVFADAPSSRLGQRYCRELYRLYAMENDAFGYVLQQDGEAVGFVVGGNMNTHDLISGKLRRHAAFAISVRPRMVAYWTKKFVGRKFGETAVPNQPRTSPRVNVDRARMSKLFLIGVLERGRGTGGARHLLDSFVQRAFSLGYEMVVLTVYRTNSRARAAYEKAGWTLNDRGGESVEYFKLKPA